MSILEEHESEQAEIAGRYEALSPLQKAVHDDLDVHLDDIPSDENECYEKLVNSGRLRLIQIADEWKLDRNEDAADDLTTALDLLSEARDCSLPQDLKDRIDTLLNGERE